MHSWYFFAGFIFLFSCAMGNKNLEPIDIEKKNPDPYLKNGCCLDVVDDSLNYIPSQTRFADEKVNNIHTAWLQVKKLYPEHAEKIKVWTEYHDFFIFSIGFDGFNKDIPFYHILYIKKGTSEFRYFWPHT